MAYKDRKKLIEKINVYNLENYDRVVIMVPKGQKSVIKAAADSAGESLGGYIKKAIQERMAKGGIKNE